MMSLKAIAAAIIGFRAIPPIREDVSAHPLHNDRVHDLMSHSQSLAAGMSRVARLSGISARAATKGDHDSVRRTVQKQSEVMSALDELAKRID